MRHLPLSIPSTARFLQETKRAVWAGRRLCIHKTPPVGHQGDLATHSSGSPGIQPSIWPKLCQKCLSHRQQVTPPSPHLPPALLALEPADFFHNQETIKQPLELLLLLPAPPSPQQRMLSVFPIPDAVP